MFKGGRLSKLAGRLVLSVVLTVSCFSATAGEERYDYDALGRLVRVIDEQGRVTEYVYDAAGNILQVITGAAAEAPTVSAITPSAIRRGEAKQIQITGSGLTGVVLGTNDPELDVSNLARTATQLTFTLAASLAALLGPRPLTLRNAAGSATATITVDPALPQVLVDPTPLAIAPDNIPRQFTIRLSNPDNIAHTIALSASNKNVIVSPASVTIAAGQTEAQANITGVSAGQSTLTLASASLGTTLVPVFVTGEFSGISTSFSRLLGVVLPSPQPSTQITPVASRLLGVLVGSAVQSVSPKTFTVGTGPSTLAISGIGLETAQAVSIAPATGITLGAISVAADGRSVTVPVTVAADAPISQRRVVVAGAGGAVFPAVPPDADRIRIVRPAPEIFSVDPIFGIPGDTIALAVRGRNLFDAQSVTLAPSTGITTGASPSVNAEGTQLAVGVAIAADAPAGPRTVIATTPGGSSSATPSAANTFSVVNQAVQTVTPVIAPALGVVLEGGPAQTIRHGFSGLLGVSVGSVITSATPATGTVGAVVSLTLAGQGLEAVTAVQFVPNTGLAVGALGIALDGRSLTVPVTIAADAPQTLRTIRVLAGATPVPFAPASASQFRVTAPLPSIDSVTPIVLRVGAPPVTLSVRGRNFQNASQVRIVPPDGMTVSVPPVVNAAGTEIGVNLSAAANAATGARAVVVVTPAGESSATRSPQNTITLASALGPPVTPVISPALGVVLESGVPPTIAVGPVISPALGVVLESGAPPPTRLIEVTATRLGVAVGAVATGIDPTGFAPNTSGTLIISGFALNGVTGVAANPGTGVTLGAPTVGLDGSQVTVPITIAAGAPATVREVRLTTAAGTVPFADPAASRFRIGVGVPQLDSITPILGSRGQTLELLIRGSNLTGALAVTATPATGIVFSSTRTPNAAGTQLTVGMAIAADAPLGPRVIQVHVPGAASSATASPANTFEVIP